MKDGRPFGIGGLWENWKEPTSGVSIRTFAIVATDANELVAEIHDRMPLILAPGDYARWLSDEPDPRELMPPFPADPMRMWPISTQAGKRRPFDRRADRFGRLCCVGRPKIPHGVLRQNQQTKVAVHHDALELTKEYHHNPTQGRPTRADRPATKVNRWLPCLRVATLVPIGLSDVA